MKPATLDRRTFVSAAAATAAVSAFGVASLAHAEEAAANATDYDLIVVGMGGAGMCCAIAAKEAGLANVVIMETNAMAGGNSIFSSSGMNAAATVYQAEQGIEDSVELMISDTMTGGKNWNDIELVTQMCEGSAAAIDWLAAHGLVLDNITTMGGASVARCHRPTDGSAVGASLVPALEAACTEAGVEVMFDTHVAGLVQNDDGAVCGVVLDDGTTYGAGAVMLATGGFGSNADMIKEYRPDLEGYVSTNAASIQGDGMVMAQAAGANLVQMDQIQIHPTVYADGSLIAEGVRGGGAILVNREGARFVNEMGTRDAVSAAELEQTNGLVWVVYDASVYEANKACAKYETKGMSISADTLEGLAEAAGIDPAGLAATVETYNGLVATSGEGDEFGRTTGYVLPLETAPFYAIPVYPGIHHCMGGIRVDAEGRALSILGDVVEGLWAAGETTGGLHGANRLGGNAVCDIVVNGIKVGGNVAAALA